MTANAFHWLRRAGAEILVPDFFETLGLAGGYTTRADTSGAPLDLDLRGDKDQSAILANRHTVARAMGLPPGDFVFAEQVHGARVAVVTAAQRGRGAVASAEAILGADALVTENAGTALAGLSADCAIILLADGRGRTAAVHSGRKGVVADVAGAAVEALVGLGADAGELYAAVGPAIGACCYEAGDEVVEEFCGAFAGAGRFVTMSGSRPHIDLAGAIRCQLAGAGVRKERMFDAGVCTACRTDLFYSYRREGRAAGRTAGVIAVATGGAGRLRT